MMGIEQEPFVKYNIESDDKYGKVYTVRLNNAEIDDLEWAKRVLSQPKDSTAMKQVFQLGLNVLHSDLTGRAISIIFKNKQKNMRTGVIDPEDL